MGLIQDFEDEAVRAIARPEINKIVNGWVTNVDPVTHKPRPLIQASDAPEMEDALFKLVGVVLGLWLENQEQKPT